MKQGNIKKVTRDIFKLGDFEKALVFVASCVVAAIYISKKIDKSPINPSTAKPVLQTYDDSVKPIKKQKAVATKKELPKKIEIESSKDKKIINEDAKILLVSDQEAIAECFNDPALKFELYKDLYVFLESNQNQEIILSSVFHFKKEESRVWYKLEKLLTSNNLYRMLIAEPSENDEVGFPVQHTYDSYNQAEEAMYTASGDYDLEYKEEEKEFILEDDYALRAEVRLIDEEPETIKVYAPGKQLSCSSQAADQICVCL